MSNIKSLTNPFQFEDWNVRTAVDDNENVWFCAKDVCAALDITWTGHVLDNVDDEWKGLVSFPTPSAENGRGGGEQNLTVINEFALYQLITRSNKPSAKTFARWIFSQVLPQIRKHGYYGVLPTKDYLAVVKQIADLTDRLTDTKNAFTHHMLVSPLRNLCNIAGHPMPELTLISQQIDQIDLFPSESGV